MDGASDGSWAVDIKVHWLCFEDRVVHTYMRSTYAAGQVFVWVTFAALHGY